MCEDHLRTVLGLQIKECALGKALFASRAFEAGEILMDYIGELLDKDKARQRYGRLTAPYAAALREDAELWVNSALICGAGAMINHSREDANVDWKVSGDRILFVANMVIHRGQQLFIGYGRMYKFGDSVHSTVEIAFDPFVELGT